MPRKKRSIPKLAELPPPEQDLQELLYRFEDAVYQGAPLSFATLRELWKEMQLSFIFETRPLSSTHDDFVQSLFASALDCLEIPLRPRSKELDTRQQAKPDSTNQQKPQSSEGCNRTVDQQEREGDGPALSSLPEVQGELESHLRCVRSNPHQATLDTSPPDLPRQSLSIADLIGSSSEDDVDRTEADEGDHLARVLQSLQGPRKKQKAKASQPEASAPADDFELGDPAWDLLADLPDLAEHMTEDILLEPIPEDLPFNETAYSRAEIRPQAVSAEGRDPGTSVVPQVPIHLSDHIPYAPYQNVQLAQDRPPEPHVTRVGSVFLLYAIYKAQPSLRRVRIYVPLHLLRGLTWMCQQSIEAAHVLKALWKEDAFVVGAVRRPISGSREAREAGRAVKTVIHPDQMEQAQVAQSAILQLSNTCSDLASVQHIQLLCNSYKAAQAKLFQNREGIKGLFDMDLGDKLGDIVSTMKNDLVLLLQQKAKGKQDVPPKQAAATGADRAKDTAQARPNKRGAEDSDRVNGDEESPQVAAAKRRRMREAESQNQDEDDMPTLFNNLQTHGASIVGQIMEEMSDSEIQQLPKAAQNVVRKEMGEAREARNILSSWTQAFGGNNCGDQPESAQQDGPPDPANGPAAAASEKPTTQTAGAGSNKDGASKIPPRQKGRASAKRKAEATASPGRAQRQKISTDLPTAIPGVGGPSEGMAKPGSESQDQVPDNKSAFSMMDKERADPPGVDCEPSKASSESPPHDTAESSRLGDGVMHALGLLNGAIFNDSPSEESNQDEPTPETHPKTQHVETREENPTENVSQPRLPGRSAAEALADALKEASDILAGL